MKTTKQELFAIYKNGEHKGNERASNKQDAVKKYLIASDFSELLNDMEFINQYSAKKAINGVHYYLGQTKQIDSL